MTRVRVRQHVNPLCQKYQTIATLPDWEKVYVDRLQPLHLDIGCARGRFLLKMAIEQPKCNFLGLEIREPLVDEANRQRDELGLTNLYFLFANANNSLGSILQSLPSGTLQRVTIQFPDPWFKRKHAKRRVVKPEIVDILATFLVLGGEVFLQSDVEEVAIEMRDRFLSHPAFQLTHFDWLATNPLPVPTEREIATLAHQEPVYRALFQRINSSKLTHGHNIS
ncbi:MAG: tRNA (guanosine(46)-N7)-methyltransferase TrmB [Cyanosarcina radialis HA8281-LM2]|jgi:tRNA (guanine-N7-)-methyltransferase|nr:tRNA (guanosine(46)-N7)-methyltransferase TrmB [Cyanosarcina radialis HA8281-LM2]